MTVVVLIQSVGLATQVNVFSGGGGVNSAGNPACGGPNGVEICLEEPLTIYVGR